MNSEKPFGDASVVPQEGLDPDVSGYLRRLGDAARAVLGANLIAAYAAGSVGLADYLPSRSDIDVALVCEDPLLPETKHALVNALRHEVIPCPARGLELVVYQRAIAESGTSEPGFEVELNSGPAMDFRATYDGRDRTREDGRFWYALDRSILHQQAYRLFGLPSAEMFVDVSPTELRTLILEAMSWSISRPTLTEGESADAVLGACRSLVKLRYGVWLSKVRAGQRLLQDGDSHVIEHAVAARAGGASPPTPEEARSFQERVLCEIRGGGVMPPH